MLAAVLPTPASSAAYKEANSVDESIPCVGLKMQCSVGACERVVRARGLCIKHYNKARNSGELELALPRRKDDLCIICRSEKAVLPRSSYCRGCASNYERERRRKNANEINARRRASYTPEKRRAEKLRRYGLTTDCYQRILVAQGGVCAICKQPGELHVDHDHACCPQELRSCGKCIRGLLCPNCNNGLGRFEDDAARLKRAAAYLEEPVATAWVESLQLEDRG